MHNETPMNSVPPLSSAIESIRKIPVVPNSSAVRDAAVPA